MSVKLKKTFKAAGIVLLSILCLAILSVLVLSWTVLTPSRLTGVARKAVDRYVPCRTEINEVGLSLVRTYPFLGFRTNGLTVFDEMESSPYDTLLHVNDLAVTVDINAFLKRREIVITKFLLDGVKANLFTASDGCTNLDFISSGPQNPEPETDEVDSFVIRAEVEVINLLDISARYDDRKSGMLFSVDGINSVMAGRMMNDSIVADLQVYSDRSMNAVIANDSSSVSAQVGKMSVKAAVHKFENLIFADARVSAGGVMAQIDDMSLSMQDFGVDVTGIQCELSDSSLAWASAGLANAVLSEMEFNQASDMKAGLGSLQLCVPSITYRNDAVLTDTVVLSAGGIGFEMTDSLGQLTRGSISNLCIDLLPRLSANLSRIDESMSLNLKDLVFCMEGSNGMLFKTPELSFAHSLDVMADSVRFCPVLSSDCVEFVAAGERLVKGWPVCLSADISTDRNLGFFRMLLETSVNRIALKAQTDLKLSDGMKNIRGNAAVNIPAFNIEKAVSMLPDSVRMLLDGISVKGDIGVAANVKGAYLDGTPVLDKASASVSLDGFTSVVGDSLSAWADKMDIMATYPSSKVRKDNAESADVRIGCNSLTFAIDGQMKADGKIAGLGMDVSAMDFLDSTKLVYGIADVNMKAVSAHMDTMNVSLDDFKASATLSPSDGLQAMMVNLGLGSLSGNVGQAVTATLGNTSVKAMARLDESNEDPLLKWDPRVQFGFEDLEMVLQNQTVEVPSLDMDFSLGRFLINDSRVVVGNSDVSLWGEIYNIGPFLENTGLLTGELFLESDFVDVNQIMSMTSGFGSDESSEKQTVTEETPIGSDTLKSGPFIVPMGVDMTMYTNFSKIDFGNHMFNNVGGDVTVKDGTVVLQELGFSSNAAEMQLTAIYDAPCIDSLFVEMDFHLLDIQVDELIDLIPSVDSVVPMLKSFDGEAQFHFAAETFLKPDYTPIMSTMLGAAAIEGKDLVVMDNDVFDGIKRKLLMSRKAENVIDSLEVEMQIIRNKVTLYPFKVHMDKYTAVIGGRHNINKDLDCKYHVSLVESPLPIRLGVTVSGSLFDISEKPLKHIRLKRPEYKTYYQPEKRNDLEQQIGRMQSGILQTLRSNVR